MFIVVKKDYNEKAQTAQVKILGVFSHKSDAFFLADKHSAVGFNNDAESDNEEAYYWFTDYTSRGHKYLVEVYKINDDHFDEVDIANFKMGNNQLGYAFTW